MSRLSGVLDPERRRRAVQFAVDAALLAAAFALAFRLRFLDTPGGIPERYWAMLWHSVAFVALGKAVIFEILGLHREWWRYFRLPELWPLVRGAGIASALLVGAFVLARPFNDGLPRSVIVFD